MSYRNFRRIKWFSAFQVESFFNLHFYKVQRVEETKNYKKLLLKFVFVYYTYEIVSLTQKLFKPYHKDK